MPLLFEPPPKIFVIDTGVLIALKSLPKPERVWTVLEVMGRMLDSGALAFPRKVKKEMTAVKWMDAPGSWLLSRPHGGWYGEPTDESFAEVVASCPDMVDASGDFAFDKADPYVVALAYQIQDDAEDATVVTVATSDFKDRNGVMSVASAALAMGLKWCNPEEFLEQVEAYARGG